MGIQWRWLSRAGACSTGRTCASCLASAFQLGDPSAEVDFWWKTKDCLIPNQRYHCHSVMEPMSSWIFSLRREMICITDSVICRRQWGYQIKKLELGALWLWSLCFLYHPIHIPERSTWHWVLNHQTFMCSSSASLFWWIICQARYPWRRP